MKEFIATILPLSNNFGADRINYDHVDVRRRHILTDTWRAFQRNHFTDTNSLKVHFVGEGTVDDGGPRREYMNLVMHELLDSPLFQSSSQTKLPATNTKNVMEKNFICWAHYSYVDYAGRAACPRFSKV